MSDRKTLPGYRLALFATALAVVVVLLGAYTRLTHAGLGCPDWPGCYGFIGVPMSEHKQAVAEARFPEAPVEVEKGWNEMVHRYFAGSLGLVILGLAVQALHLRGQDGQPCCHSNSLHRSAPPTCATAGTVCRTRAHVGRATPSGRFVSGDSKATSGPQTQLDAVGLDRVTRRPISPG